MNRFENINKKCELCTKFSKMRSNSTNGRKSTGLRVGKSRVNEPKAGNSGKFDKKPSRDERSEKRSSGDDKFEKRPLKENRFEKKNIGSDRVEKRPVRAEGSEKRFVRSEKFDKKPLSEEIPEKKRVARNIGPSKRPERNILSADTVQKKGYKLDEKIRLNRFLANSGVCSRREADTFIQSGCVTVNGKIVSELGVKVTTNDDVRFNGEQLNPERKVYLLLNKPKGFVSTTDDPQERKTVMNLVENACSERIYPVGRLDKDTTGLLLFTNDGDLAKRLTHPSYTRKKIYHAHLDKPLTKNDLLEIAKGIELEDGFIAADSINYVNEEDKREVGIEIHSGKNRIVRRIFSHLGYEVEKLDRVLFAGLTKKNLPRGKWRFLTTMEINQLKMH